MLLRFIVQNKTKKQKTANFLVRKKYAIHNPLILNNKKEYEFKK